MTACPRSRSTTAHFQDLVNEARLRISPALPGVDRAQRLRSRDHAGRAVRLADRDDHLPAQPRAGEAARDAARPARDPSSSRRSRRRPTCASGSSAPATEPVAIPAGETEVGTVRTASEEAIVFQTTEDFTIPPRAARSPTPSSAAARSRTSASPAASPSRRAPTRLPFGTPPKAGDALYLGFDDAAREHAARGRRRLLAGARRRRRPRGSAAALGGLRRRARRAAGSRPRWSRT